MMKVMDRGMVFLGEDGGEYSSACFPSLCVLPDGRWLVGFRASPAKKDGFPQRSVLTWSDDEGRTWTKPVEPFAPQALAGQPGVWRGVHLTPLGGARVAAYLYWVDASDRTLPFFNEQTEGLLDSRLFLAFSNDGGQTWTLPRLLETTPFNMPTPFTGPILLLANGEWALQFETNKSYYDTSVWRHQAVLMFSRDEGETWPEYVDVASDPEGRYFYWDQRPNVLGDGSLLDVFWTYDRQKSVYLKIQARQSSDHGRTWSPVWDTGIAGQPAAPVSVRDGRAVMPYVDRESIPMIKMRASGDGGLTWPAATEIVLDRLDRVQAQRRSSMQDAWAEMAAFSIGLPVAALLHHGDVLVVYYAGQKPDHTGIYWVRVHP